MNWEISNPLPPSLEMKVEDDEYSGEHQEMTIPPLLSLEPKIEDDGISPKEHQEIPAVPPTPVMPSPKSRVVVRPTPISGRNIPFPYHILELLEKWHEENGNKRPPPCSQRDKSGSKRFKVFKAFDRESQELDLITYSILQPIAYIVRVLYQNGNVKIVGSYNHTANAGTFLAVWDGTEYVPGGCAVKIFGDDLEKIECSDEIWKHAPTDLEPVGSKTSRQSISSQTPSESQPEIRKRGFRQSTRLREIATPESSSTTGSAFYVDWPERDYEDYEHSEGEDIPFLPSLPKKRKTGKDDDVFFKFVKPKSGKQTIVEVFTLEECGTIKGLFSKAQKFFQPGNKNVEVSDVYCQIPSQSEVHKISKTNKASLDFFLDDVKQFKCTQAPGKLTVDVVDHID
ncbi:hypothetical protein MW887_002740 [Aspergillus wentii]|nr:hypothetical protein MW887_002740 [Aspergillus wentii]